MVAFIVGGLTLISAPLDAACSSVIAEREGERYLVIRDSMTVREAKEHLQQLLSSDQTE